MQNSGISNDVVTQLKHRARVLRGHMLRMAKGQGQGYIGQGLGIADLMAALDFTVALRPPEHGMAGARPLPSFDRPLFNCFVGSLGRGRRVAGRRTRDLWP